MKKVIQPRDLDNSSYQISEELSHFFLVRLVNWANGGVQWLSGSMGACLDTT